MANTAFRVIPGHGDVAVPCRYSGHSLFGERAQQRDPYAPLCGIRHIQPTLLIWGDLCDIDDRLVRQADFAQISVDHSIFDAAFARGRIVSGVKTDFAPGPSKAPMPPSHASAHADAQRRPSGTIVENRFRRIASPIRRPASKLPPSELKATKAEDKDAALAANWSSSNGARDPSTTTTIGLSGVCSPNRDNRGDGRGCYE